MTERESRDLIIVGAGPAGLNAAINAESEGLNTLVVDAADYPGGQAAKSTRIENYGGFPGGVSGSELTGKMVDQALGFSTTFIGPCRVEELEPTEDGIIVRDDTEEFLGKTVLLAMGVGYKRLVVQNLFAYLGRGVHYGTPSLEEERPKGDLYVVGGANSAGQAAVYLSESEACRVNLLIRGDDIRKSMSEYLVERLEKAENVTIQTNTQVVGVDGNGSLGEITLKRSAGDEPTEEKVPANRLFIFIGAEPKTAWLRNIVDVDPKGFVVTGRDLPDESRDAFQDQTGRLPFEHETRMPGVFAAGDIRCGTTKRVVVAGADGVIAVGELHRYFASLKNPKS